jgi:hypothetical protein
VARADDPLAGGPDDGGVTLHSSWRGIVFSTLGAVLLAVLGVAALATAGPGWFPIALAIAGAGSVVVVLVDLPIASTFDASGVTRRALLRHQHLDWAKVTRLRRQRVGVVRTHRSGPAGGLVAESGRRNYLLVDVMENGFEYDRLVAVIGPSAERLGLTADQRPPDDQPPTWLHRRAHWRPEGFTA